MNEILAEYEKEEKLKKNGKIITKITYEITDDKKRNEIDIAYDFWGDITNGDIKCVSLLRNRAKDFTVEIVSANENQRDKTMRKYKNYLDTSTILGMAVRNHDDTSSQPFRIKSIVTNDRRKKI